MTDRTRDEVTRRVAETVATTAAESAFENEGGAPRRPSSPFPRSALSRGRLKRLAADALTARRGRFPKGPGRVRADEDPGRDANVETRAVRHYMSTNVSPVRADMTMVAAAQQMRSSGVGGMPVLDPRGEKCVGILTERDIIVRILAEECDPRAAVVRDAATLRPVTCTSDDDVATALAQMR